MKNSFTEAWGNYIFDRKARIVERCLVCVEGDSVRIQHNNVLRNCVGNSTKLAFILSQLLLRLLEEFDLSACSVPSDDFARIVPKWLDANEKPKKRSIAASNTRLDLTRFSFCR